VLHGYEVLSEMFPLDSERDAKLGTPLQKHGAATFEVDAYVLCGLGLDQEQVGPTIQTLTRESTTCIYFHSKDIFVAIVEAIFKGMAGTLELKIPVNQATKRFFISEHVSAQHKDGWGSIGKGNRSRQPSLILCDHCDGEAVPASHFLYSHAIWKQFSKARQGY